jgi:hypothetical protein
MPTRKTRLLRNEQARYLARAKELKMAGVACSIPDAWEDDSRSLDIAVAPSELNILCQSPSGITACAILVHLVGLRSNLILENFSIATAWDSHLTALPLNSEEGIRTKYGLDFTNEETLNGKIANGLRLNRGDVFEGWVAATGLAAIPAEYKNWMITRLKLTFTDQFGDEHGAEADAILQRSNSKTSQLRARPSRDLFELKGNLNSVSVTRYQ